MTSREGGKSIVLTGGTGFLGSRLLHTMHTSGYRVILLKRSWSNPRRIRDVLPQVLSYDLDHCDLRDVFSRHRPDFVVHAATCYGRNGETVEQIEEANFQFPLRLLECGKAFDVKAFFNFDTFFNTKTELPDGLNYYVSSKKRLVDRAKEEAINGGIRFINLRLEHVYGPDDDAQKFVPFLIRSLVENTPLDLTAGEQYRDFIYVDDAAKALRVLLDRSNELTLPYVEAGLGSGMSISLREFVEIARGVCESAAKINYGILPYRPDEIMYSKADVTLLTELGWRPEESLTDGIRKTAEEMRKRINAESAY